MRWVSHFSLPVWMTVCMESKASRKLRLVCLFGFFSLRLIDTVKYSLKSSSLQTILYYQKSLYYRLALSDTSCSKSFPFRNVYISFIVYLIENFESIRGRRRRNYQIYMGLNHKINIVYVYIAMAFIEFDSHREMCTIDCWRLIRETMMTYDDCYAGQKWGNNEIIWQLSFV